MHCRGSEDQDQHPRSGTTVKYYPRVSLEKEVPFFALRKDTVQAAGSPDSGEMTTESKRGPGQAQVPAESKVLQRTLLPDSALPHTSSSYRVSNQGHVRGPPPPKDTHHVRLTQLSMAPFCA